MMTPPFKVIQETCLALLEDGRYTRAHQMAKQHALQIEYKNRLRDERGLTDADAEILARRPLFEVESLTQADIKDDCVMGTLEEVTITVGVIHGKAPPTAWVASQLAMAQALEIEAQLLEIEAVTAELPCAFFYGGQSFRPS
jgi:hypothetical protein